MPASEIARAYLAGLFDGEGCLTRTRSGGRVAQIAMTDREVIEYLASIGGTMRVEPKPPPRRTLYRWRLTAQADVQDFLIVVLPHLRVKRERAQEFVEELLALERAAYA
jgi:intein/homing endonuclease